MARAKKSNSTVSKSALQTFGSQIEAYEKERVALRQENNRLKSRILELETEQFKIKENHRRQNLEMNAERLRICRTLELILQIETELNQEKRKVLQKAVSENDVNGLLSKLALIKLAS